MTFQAFDVVVVPFPYSDRLAEKRRPALVVSTSDLERSCGLIWVAMITSAGRTPLLGDLVIHDLKAAGLPVASTLRAGKIATIEPRRVLRTVGRLAGKDKDAATSALHSCAAF
jgi:mRNA interferase MazF